MAGEQAAGYCGHCNRAVTIRKKNNGGLLRKLTSLVPGNAAGEEWECTRCGKPAGKSFVPSAAAPAPPAESPSPPLPVPPEAPAPVDQPEISEPSEYRDCPHCRGAIRREAFKCLHCQMDVQPLPKLAEATCHICGNTLKFEGSDHGQLRSCPTCTNLIALPIPQEDRAVKTSPPPVEIFPDDPARPNLTLGMCVACQHRLTYQKKYSGRRMNCPGCGKPLVLP